MILNRDRFAILSDIWGRFRSLSLISPVTPNVGPGDDGFLWIDIGVDGTPENPVWKMWDEHAGTWRLIGGSGAGAVDWGDVTGKPSTFPPDEHAHYKLVASDGSPDPAWSCDASGNLSSASELTLTVSGEAYVNGDKAGLMNRLVNRHLSVTDHFRSGSIPSGYSWSSTPASVNYSDRNDYLSVAANQNATHHLKKTLGAANPGWGGKRFTARMSNIGPDGSDSCGIRLSVRISGVWYHATMMLTRTGTLGTQYVIQVTTDLPGATGYTTSAVGHVPGFITMDFYVHTTYNIYTYLRSEIGTNHTFGYIGCDVSAADAGEIGLVFKSSGSFYLGRSYVDWFYSEF